MVVFWRWIKRRQNNERDEIRLEIPIKVVRQEMEMYLKAAIAAVETNSVAIIKDEAIEEARVAEMEAVAVPENKLKARNLFFKLCNSRNLRIRVTRMTNMVTNNTIVSQR